MNHAKVEEARVVQYSFRVDIEASLERVWKGLTDQLGSWWLPDFHMLGPDSLVTLEPHAGGRLFEECGDQSLLWYTVVAISPNKSMSLAGYCTPDFGGPCSTLLTISLEKSGGGTQLTVGDALYGRVSDGQASSLESGWKQLFGDGLKKFVESA